MSFCLLGNIKGFLYPGLGMLKHLSNLPFILNTMTVLLLLKRTMAKPAGQVITAFFWQDWNILSILQIFTWGTGAGQNSQGTKCTDFQFTLVWTYFLAKNKLLFTGFMDMWSQDKLTGTAKEFAFMTEPQLWFLFTPAIAVGGEVEITKNFRQAGDWHASPTVGLRWEF
jgi:hypothetical protein